MSNVELIKPYLANLTLSEPGSLIEVLNPCGAVLGLWGLQSLSERHLNRFMGKRARAGAAKILAIIEDCGFTVNPKKTVIQLQSGRHGSDGADGQ